MSKYKVYYQDENDPEAYIDRGNTAVHLSTYRQVAQFDQKKLEQTYINLFPSIRSHPDYFDGYEPKNYLVYLWSMFNRCSDEHILPDWLTLRSMAVNDIVQIPDGTLYLRADAGWRIVKNQE